MTKAGIIKERTTIKFRLLNSYLLNGYRAGSKKESSTGLILILTLTLTLVMKMMVIMMVMAKQ